MIVLFDGTQATNCSEMAQFAGVGIFYPENLSWCKMLQGFVDVG
jgi:hypothetical protein